MSVTGGFTSIFSFLLDGSIIPRGRTGSNSSADSTTTHSERRETESEAVNRYRNERGADRGPLENRNEFQLAGADKYDVDPLWIKANGDLDYPDNDGFRGSISTAPLDVSSTFDRYGGEIDASGEFTDRGSFVSPTGTSFEQRSLPNSSRNSIYTVYEVKNSIPNVSAGLVARWFGQRGGGTQHRLPYSIDYLLRNGYFGMVILRGEPNN